MAEYTIKTRKWTRAEYDKLIALGFLEPNEPVELICGELVVAEPQGALHYTAIWKTAKALEAAFGPGWIVRTQGPIGLDDESEQKRLLVVESVQNRSRTSCCEPARVAATCLRGHS